MSNRWLALFSHEQVLPTEAADILGVSQNTLRKWAKRGEKPRRRIPVNGCRQFRRANLHAAEYKHVMLGLIFLKYISDVFEEKHAELEADRKSGPDPKNPDEYRAANIF